MHSAGPGTHDKQTPHKARLWAASGRQACLLCSGNNGANRRCRAPAAFKVSPCL